MILTYLVVSDHEGQDFSSAVAGEISSWFTCLFFTRPTLDRFRSELDLVVNTVARLSFGQRIFSTFDAMLSPRPWSYVTYRLPCTLKLEEQLAPKPQPMKTIVFSPLPPANCRTTNRCAALPCTTQRSPHCKTLRQKCRCAT